MYTIMQQKINKFQTYTYIVLEYILNYFPPALVFALTQMNCRCNMWIIGIMNQQQCPSHVLC